MSLLPKSRMNQSRFKIYKMQYNRMMDWRLEQAVRSSDREAQYVVIRDAWGPFLCSWKSWLGLSGKFPAAISLEFIKTVALLNKIPVIVGLMVCLVVNILLSAFNRSWKISMIICSLPAAILCMVSIVGITAGIFQHSSHGSVTDGVIGSLIYSLVVFSILFFICLIGQRVGRLAKR